MISCNNVARISYSFPSYSILAIHGRYAHNAALKIAIEKKESLEKRDVHATGAAIAVLCAALLSPINDAISGQNNIRSSRGVRAL